MGERTPTTTDPQRLAEALLAARARRRETILEAAPETPIAGVVS